MHTDGEPADRAQVAMALAEVEAIRRRVLNVVGHSLRTPVTTIAGMATALEHTDDEETRAVLIAGLARNARRLEDMVDGLLVAAGITTAVPVDERSATSMHRVLEQAWERVGDGDGLVINGPDVVASVRENACRQIVELIMDNARKYGNGPISATIEPRDGHVHVHVQSQGEGPTDEEFQHAFELMYRGEHAVMSSPGMGIGLFVARQLATMEGGNVTMTRGGGAIIATVALPL